MVVVSHYADWYSDYLPSEPLHYALTQSGVYGVDLFFIVSGYGLVKSETVNKSALYYWKNRLKTTYIPYLVLAGIIGLCTGSLHTPEAVFRLLTGFDFWFIRNILVFYVLFFLVFWSTEKRWLRAVLFTAGCFGYSWWLVMQGRGSFWFVSNVAFWIGVVIALYEKELLRVFNRLAYLWLIGLGIILVLLLKKGMDLRFTPVTNYVKMISGTITNGIWTLLWVQAAAFFRGRWRFLRFVGGLSLELYLLHHALYSLVLMALEPGGRIVAGVAALLFTLAVAWLVNWLFERLWKFSIRHMEKKR